MLKQNSQIGIRVSETQITEYTKLCKLANSVMSMRLRKFIELELKFQKKGIDLLQYIQNIDL